MDTLPTEKLNIGDKIKNFRKRAGLTQLDLETEIDCATGSISRIEAGKVNPTKETLLQISKTLKLTEKELADLMEVRPIQPTTEEIQAALEETGNLLSQDDRYIYLVDENSIVYAVSEGFINLLKIDRNNIPKFAGKPVLELIFDPAFGILKYLDLRRSLPAAAIEIARLNYTQKGIAKFLNNRFRRMDHYQELLKESEKVKYEDTVSTPRRQVYIYVNGKSKAFRYNKENLRINFRFGLVEYYQVEE